MIDWNTMEVIANRMRPRQALLPAVPQTTQWSYPWPHKNMVEHLMLMQSTLEEMGYEIRKKDEKP